MGDTFDLILRLSDERREIYRLAAQEQLTFDQRKYLEELNAKIPLVWDQYRRELANEERQTDRRTARKDTRHPRVRAARPAAEGRLSSQFR